MSGLIRICIGAVAILVLPLAVMADEVRYFQRDGVTYRETRQTIRRPVVETQMQPREETVYREQVATEMRDNPRTVFIPVTQYVYEPRVHNLLNPFSPTYIAYHPVPRTYWETRTETVRVPVTYREVVPETRVVQTPVTSLRFVEEEKVDVVAVSPPAAPLLPQGQTPAVIARRDQIGGVLRLEGDPPRYGSRGVAAPSSLWR